MISIVVAVSENRVIGKDNRLLWKLSNDMKFFKNLTMGGLIIMGRKTFESIGKALPGRINVVITRQQNWSADLVMAAQSVEVAMEKAKQMSNDVFIIGGGEIYQQTLDWAERVYLTRVHTQLEGDTFFPDLDQQKWELASQEHFIADEKNEYDHSIEVWVKKQSNTNTIHS